jgi:hypothetical protein
MRHTANKPQTKNSTTMKALLTTGARKITAPKANKCAAPAQHYPQGPTFKLNERFHSTDLSWSR